MIKEDMDPRHRRRCSSFDVGLGSHTVMATLHDMRAGTRLTKSQTNVFLGLHLVLCFVLFFIFYGFYVLFGLTSMCLPLVHVCCADVVLILGVKAMSSMTFLPYALNGTLTIALYVLHIQMSLATGGAVSPTLFSFVIFPTLPTVFPVRPSHFKEQTLLHIALASGVMVMLLALGAYPDPDRLGIAPPSGPTPYSLQWIHMRMVVFTATIVSFSIAQYAGKQTTQTQLRLTKEAADKATQLKQYRIRVLSVLSHDMRTPLQAMLSDIEMFTSATGDNERVIDPRTLAVMKESTHLLVRLLNNALVFASLHNSPSVSLSYAHVQSFVTCCASVLDEYAFLADTKSLQLSFSSSDGIDASAWMAPERFRHAFRVILLNAIKHTDSGSVSVELCTSTERPETFDLQCYRVLEERFHGKNPLWLTVAVKDTGGGLPDMASLQSLFDSFVQINPCLTGGTGIGLHVFRSQVHIMGGGVGCHPRADSHGSVFWFSVPLWLEATTRPRKTLPVNESLARPSLTPSRTTIRQRNWRVLIVDDDVFCATAVQSMLRSLFTNQQGMGSTIHITHSVSEATSLLTHSLSSPDADQGYHVVFVDLNLGTAQGTDIVTSVKNFVHKERCTKPIPLFLCMSGSVQEHLRQHSVESGFYNFLQKPVSVANLKSTLEDIEPAVFSSKSLSASATQKHVIELEMPLVPKDSTPPLQPFRIEVDMPKMVILFIFWICIVWNMTTYVLHLTIQTGLMAYSIMAGQYFHWNRTGQLNFVYGMALLGIESLCTSGGLLSPFFDNLSSFIFLDVLMFSEFDGMSWVLTFLSYATFYCLHVFEMVDFEQIRCTEASQLYIGPVHVIVAICVYEAMSMRASHNYARVYKDYRLAAEAALKDKHATEVFLSALCHDIRTPLMSILGAASLCTERVREVHDGLHEADAARVQTIKTCANIVLALTRGLIPPGDDSHSAMRRATLRPFQLRPFLADSLRLFRRAAVQKGLLLHLDVSQPGLPTEVVGDKNYIQQALLNLLNNALRYTHHGEVVVKVYVENDVVLSLAVMQTHTTQPPRPHRAAYITFEVRDSGEGIAESDIPLLFNPFRQVSSDMKSRHQGVGLGLAIVKDLVEAMGGQITVQSRRHEGTSFRFHLPLLPLPESANAEQAPVQDDDALSDEERALSRLAFKDKRILVAEDNPFTQTVLQQMLEHMGLMCTICSDGLAALQELQHPQPCGDEVARPYDLVVLDINMPVLDGISTAQKIRHDLQMDIAMLVLSASIDEYDWVGEQLQQCGFSGVLSKPITMNCLQRTLTRVLSC